VSLATLRRPLAHVTVLPHVVDDRDISPCLTWLCCRSCVCLPVRTRCTFSVSELRQARVPGVDMGRTRVCVIHMAVLSSVGVLAGPPWRWQRCSRVVRLHYESTSPPRAAQPPRPVAEEGTPMSLLVAFLPVNTA
jgi:hypothetical protein